MNKDLNENKDLYIIKFIKNQQEHKYAIDCEEEGYLTINHNSIIAKLIIKMDVNDTNELLGDKFILTYRNKPLKYRINIKELEEYNQKQLKEKLIEILKCHNNLGFFHETHIENLNSIYKENHIYSRNKLKEKNIIPVSIAEIEVLKRTNEFYFDCARFYLRSNTPANYKFEGHTCILVCDYDIINSDNWMYITDLIATENPRKNYLHDDNDLLNILTNFDYNKIYEQEYVDKYSFDVKYKHAEFLSKEKVSLKYINTIIFKNNNDKEWFEKKFPDWNIQIIVDTQFFKKSQ